jgi:hypothetical protein
MWLSSKEFSIAISVYSVHYILSPTAHKKELNEMVLAKKFLSCLLKAEKSTITVSKSKQ